MLFYCDHPIGFIHSILVLDGIRIDLVFFREETDKHVLPGRAQLGQVELLLKRALPLLDVNTDAG